MIRSLDDFSRIAQEKGPKKLAVLASEDEEIMRAVKRSWQVGYIEPVLIGNVEKMGRVADKVEFDIGRFEKIIADDRQAIADLGINMLFFREDGYRQQRADPHILRLPLDYQGRGKNRFGHDRERDNLLGDSRPRPLGRLY